MSAPVMAEEAAGVLEEIARSRYGAGGDWTAEECCDYWSKLALEYRRAARDLLQRLRSQSGPLPVQGGQRYRHKKRGETVTVLGEAEAQISIDDGNGINCRLVCEADKIVVYQADDGKLWWRFPDEFYDGRFEPLPHAPGQDPAAGPEVMR